MIALEGDCRTPLAAHAVRDGDVLRLRAFVAEPDGSRLRRAEDHVNWPGSDEEAEAVGRGLGERLISAG
jgi:hydroxymethylbilane synthase